MDDDDQSRSDNIYYMRLLHERACKALCIDPDRNSWFDIVDQIEDQLATKTRDRACLEVIYGFDLSEGGRGR